MIDEWYHLLPQGSKMFNFPRNIYFPREIRFPNNRVVRAPTPLTRMACFPCILPRSSTPRLHSGHDPAAPRSAGPGPHSGPVGPGTADRFCERAQDGPDSQQARASRPLLGVAICPSVVSRVGVGPCPAESQPRLALPEHRRELGL